MSLPRLAIAFVFVVLGSSTQAAEPKPVTELSEMRWLIGKWKIATTLLPGDNDDMGKPGDKLTIDLDYRQFNEETFYEQVKYTANGQTRNVRFSVMAVDPETKVVTLWNHDPSFTSKGQVHRISDKEYRVNVKGKSQRGQNISLVMVWKILDDNTFTNQFTDFRWGKESFPDTPADTAKRQK